MFKENFEVRNPGVEALLREIGSLVGSAVSSTPGYGFALLIFSLGEGGDMFYVSSAEREGVIRAMEEFKQKFREN